MRPWDVTPVQNGSNDSSRHEGRQNRMVVRGWSCLDPPWLAIKHVSTGDHAQHHLDSKYSRPYILLPVCVCSAHGLHHYGLNSWRNGHGSSSDSRPQRIFAGPCPSGNQNAKACLASQLTFLVALGIAMFASLMNAHTLS